MERIQVLVSGLTDSRHAVTCNGKKLPLHPTGEAGQFVAGVRYRARQLTHCLHPDIPVDGPLVFDFFDLSSNRSIGGCVYHVGHPGGRNPSVYPVNANEAESRRACRFFANRHTAGPMPKLVETRSSHYPLTLDLRRASRLTRSPMRS